jgi:hypothetical protein
MELKDFKVWDLVVLSEEWKKTAILSDVMGVLTIININPNRENPIEVMWGGTYQILVSPKEIILNNKKNDLKKSICSHKKWRAYHKFKKWMWKTVN